MGFVLFAHNENFEPAHSLPLKLVERLDVRALPSLPHSQLFPFVG